jgi:hypothetical protein
MFYEELITLMEGASESWRLTTKGKYATILNVMIRLHTGKPIKLLRSIYPQIYKWCKNYALVASGESFILVARPDDVIGVDVIDETVDVDTVKSIMGPRSTIHSYCFIGAPRSFVLVEFCVEVSFK